MNNIDTILIDIGWPIIDETESHRAWNKYLTGRIKELKNITLSGKEIKRLEEEAVNCFAPSLFSYVIWQLVKPDEKLFYKLRGEFDNFDYSEFYRLQPGVGECLEKLNGKFKLGIAANQPAAVHSFLEKEGILQYFNSRLVSRDIGFSKPDTRMFLKVLENMQSEAGESLMVGDRLDNDIIPAKLIGMITALVQVGPHKNQAPRSPQEKPDYVIGSLPEILNIRPIQDRL